jgi:hypothetical protein
MLGRDRRRQALPVPVLDIGGEPLGGDQISKQFELTITSYQTLFLIFFFNFKFPPRRKREHRKASIATLVCLLNTLSVRDPPDLWMCHPRILRACQEINAQSGG